MKSLKNEIWQSLKLILLALAFSAGISYVFAWTGPTATAPNSNAPAPINVSATSQVKSGGLGVTNLVADTLCLGINCISNWANVTSRVPSVQVFTSPVTNATYVPPANTSYIIVEIWGGGGGGANLNGPGGGGGYSMKIIATPLSSYKYTIGAGGTANGGTGGQSCFGINDSACSSPILGANGGGGGGNSSPASGGSGFNGDLNLTGSAGATTGGAGGSAPRGGGGGRGNGGVGNSFGGGGGGGQSSANGAAGGVGGMVIHEY